MPPPLLLQGSALSYRAQLPNTARVRVVAHMPRAVAVAIVMQIATPASWRALAGGADCMGCLSAVASRRLSSYVPAGENGCLWDPIAVYTPGLRKQCLEI